MADKLRRHEVESNPETQPAREHWEKASAGAETNEEREVFARLRGLIDGGAAASYWGQVAPIMQARLQKVQAAVIEQAAKVGPMAEEARVLAEQERATEELQVKQEAPVESDGPTVGENQ